MASKQAAVKKPRPEVVGGTEAAPKAPRKPKTPPMPMAQRFELMALVKDADPATPDATLALLATEKFGRPIQQQTIADYRKQFGLKSVRRPGAAALAAYVDVLKAALTAAGVAIPEMPQETAPESSETPEPPVEG